MYRKHNVFKTVRAVLCFLLAFVIAAGGYYAIVRNAVCKSTVKALDEKYDCLYSVFSDKLASKEEYIDVFEESYRKTIVYFGRGFSGQVNEKFGHTIMNLNLASSPFNLDYGDCGVVVHEVKHAENQHNLFGMYNYEPIHAIFCEGAAKFWELFSVSSELCDDGYIEVFDEEGIKSCFCCTPNYDIGYGVGSNGYMKLLMLTDYATLQEFTVSLDKNILYDRISAKYGINSKRFINNLIDLCGFFTQGEAVIENEIEFFNKYVLWDVKAASGRDELLRVFNQYRFLKAEALTHFYRDGVECTQEYIDLSPVENVLFARMREYGIFDALSQNEDEQRFIFDSLLYLPRGIDEGFAITELPMNVSDMKIIFSAQKGIVEFTDPDSQEVLAFFNTDGLCRSSNYFEVYDNDTGALLESEADYSLITGTELVLK